MKALGLPNTKHFHEITKIEDAIACTLLFYTSHMHWFGSETNWNVDSGGAIES